MTILTVSLAQVQTLSDLATALQVPPAALRLVTLSPTHTCRRATCSLPACEYNHRHYILCSQSWYPAQYNEKGEKKENVRGYGLYGPQFMRNHNNKVQPGVCGCDDPTCVKIGYSHEGMFYLPTDLKSDCRKLKQGIQVLGVKAATRHKIMNNPRAFKVAPWHYHPEHREYRDGKWHLVKMRWYTDDKGVRYDFPPPNYSLQKFIKNEIKGVGWFDNRLPDWAEDFIRQANAVYDQRLKEAKAAEGTSSTKKRKRELEAEPDVAASAANSVAELIQKTRPKHKKKSREDSHIAQLESQVSSLQFKLSKVIEAMSTLRTEKEDALNSAADKESKLQRAKTIIENLMKTVKEKDEMIHQLKEEIAELRDEKLEAQEEKLLEEVGRNDTPQKSNA